jgi:REP-associated tyrosine transposase
MPRKARIDAPGALHHIIGRGIEGCPIFKDDEDRDHFIQRLGVILSDTSTRCYAWALIPNHFHLLLKTGTAPIATVMRRLLTGYAVSFNRRHHRHGHLFQNRYKSILCQEDTYLKELVRYIHLNPLRANLVSGLIDLDKYPYGGHSCLMGKRKHIWQSIDDVLGLFANKGIAARKNYHAFVERGILIGRQPELTGGGLIRSVGGWHALKTMRRMDVHLKSDERILGDSDFVEGVLSSASEELESQYKLKVMGVDFNSLVKRVADIFDIDADQVWVPGKHPQRVLARSVLAYWAVRNLGLSGVEVSTRLGLSQSATSRAVQRGALITKERAVVMIENRNA